MKNVLADKKQNMYGKMKSRKGKKGKQSKKELVNQFIYILDNIKFSSFSKQGYGPKKTECQDSYCVMDSMGDKEKD